MYILKNNNKNKVLTLLLGVFSINASALLTDDTIVSIYQNFVRPYQNNENKSRYVPLPLEKNNISWKWEGKDFPRVIALLEFERFVESYGKTYQKGLSINDTKDPEWLYLDVSRKVITNFEDDPLKYDLHNLILDEQDFDFVMVNQTLEHTYDPITCLKNIKKYMKSGGIIYFNVPANNIPHAIPFHYYTGFTPVGVGVLVKAAGFEILTIGQWGNVDFLKRMYETQDFPDYRAIANPGRNEFNCPIIVWVFARKP